MKTSADRYKFKHSLTPDVMKTIRIRILEGDSILNIAKDLNVRYDVVCCAAEQIIKELKSPVYFQFETSEEYLYTQQLPAIWRLPEIKAPTDFKGVKIINTFEASK